MGYYTIDRLGKRHWVNDPNDKEGDDPISWVGVAYAVFLIVAIWFATTFLAGCRTQKAVTVQKDSVAVTDSARQSIQRTDSLVWAHRDSIRQSIERYLKDSTIVSERTNTVCTLMVDTSGRVLSQNTVTTIERNRDHFRDLTQMVDNTRTAVDSLTALHSEQSSDTMVRNQSAIHSSDKAVTVEKTEQSWWDGCKTWMNGLCIGILLAVLLFIGWRIYRA